MKILITGANGFIGRALYRALLEQGHDLSCVFRERHQGQLDREFASATLSFVENIDGNTDWKASLEEVDVVVHLAALAHMMTKTDFDQDRIFLAVNYEGTRNLAVQAAQKGVKRFVFISSIGVNGKANHGGPFSEKDVEHPHNSYTIAKFKAESVLREIEAKSSMEVVIIRPPLVYGPYVKANFFKLLNLVHTGLPLPFAGIANKRSFIALENLVDAIAVCTGHENAGGKTFLVSDGKDLSTEELIRIIARAMGKTPKLFSVPDRGVKFFLGLVGRQNIYERLWGSLSVDATRIHQDLSWIPRVSIDQAIERTVLWYLKSRHRYGKR